MDSNDIKEKLQLARARYQNLLAQQEQIVSDLKDEIGIKNTELVLTRQYISSESDIKWLNKTLEQLIFLLNARDQ